MTDKYNWAEDPRPVCIIPDGGFSSLSQIGDCKFPQDYSGPLISFSSEIVDKHGHPLDGDNDPHGKNGCDHRDTKEWKAEHRHKKIEKKEIKEVKTEQLTATVEVPTRPIDVPKPPQKADGLASLPILTGAIAGAVSSAAGPVAGKFLKTLFNKLFKNNKFNAKEDKKEQPTDCKTSQMNTFARFRTLEAKVSALEGKEGSGNIKVGSNSLEEIIERLENLEKGRKKSKEKI
jgi:hypothetical protein